MEFGRFCQICFVGCNYGGSFGWYTNIFQAAGFWGTIGVGSLTGGATGGISSLMSGQNFFEGLLKGAVIGGAVGTVSYGLGKLFNGKESVQLNAEGKFSYDGQQFSDKGELINYIQKNNGDVNMIMKKLKISDIELASANNLPSDKVIFEKGFMFEYSGTNKSQVFAKTINSEGYSKIWISPGLKGVNIDGHNLAKTFINHEFIHSYHLMKGLTNITYLERSAWPYNYAYARYNGLNITGFTKNIGRFKGFNIPGAYKWSTSGISNFIKLF